MVTGCVLLCAGMWGLVNNAGISTFGEVEFTSMETYKEVAEVNLWGTVRTTKSFLPLLRRAKGELGRESLPAHPSLDLSNLFIPVQNGNPRPARAIIHNSEAELWHLRARLGLGMVMDRSTWPGRGEGSVAFRSGADDLGWWGHL